MDSNLEQWVPQVGMDVVGSDDQKVGAVDAVEQDYFVVQKGFFFPEDHYIPLSAVTSYDDKKVFLNVTKDQALEQQWTTPPVAGYDSARTDLDANREDDLAAVDTTAQPGIGTQGRDADLTNRDDINIPVHEEEMTATRREVDRGSVRVNKNVVEEQRDMDVPVTEERVNVSRRDVDREATADETAFEEGTIEIPVHGEEVDVQKRTRVTGEVDVDKTAEQHTEHVSDTVRREEVSIEGEEVGKNRRDEKRR